MTTIVHILATAVFASAVAVILYWLMRWRQRQLGKECAIIFAVFGSGLISVAAIKTNSPPARAIGHVLTSLCTNAFNAIEQQTGYSFSDARTNETHDLTMPANAQLAERIARRGAHQDGFYLFDSFTNRLAREGLDIEHPVWVQTDGTVTVRSRSPGIPIEELALYTTYSNITVYAPLQGSYGFLPASRWPEFNVSRIWAAVTDRGTRVITWEGVLRHRDTTQPVSFQAEFKSNGDIEYHYTPTQTNFTGIGLYRGEAAMSFDRSTVEPFNRLGDEPSTNVPSSFLFPLSTLHLSYIGDLGDGTGDTDDDGLTDWQEIKVYHTDPHLADTDCDGVVDGDEVQNGTDPLNPDTDGNGIPDGTTPEAWSNNVLRATAETANFSVTLLEAVPPGGHASLRVGDLTVLLSNAGTYWFNLPTNAVNTFSFASQGCGGLLLDAAVVAAPPTRGAPPDAPYHIEDADGILGTGRRAESGTFSVFWPWLRLVPRDGTECLHDFETSRIFDIEAGPMDWGNVPQGSITLENLDPEYGGYKLSLDGENFATGLILIHPGWAAPLGMAAAANIHKCNGWGLRYCHLCGVYEFDQCNHSDNCEAHDGTGGNCTCPSLLIPVNLDDDDGDGVEDRNDASVQGEDDIVAFCPIGDGVQCCCEPTPGPDSANVTSLPSCLRATRGGSAFSGGVVAAGESINLEAVSASAANSRIVYVVTDEDYEQHTYSRKIVAANAVMHPDFDADGTYTAADTAFAQAHGLGPGCWPLPPRTTPFKIRVTYEIPTDCSLRAYLTGNAPARVSYGNATPTVENGDTYFTLPNGSGTCELSISSPGVDAFGGILLELIDADGYNHYLSSQCFSTAESVIERERYLTATNNPGRVRIRLWPSLYNVVADWTLSPSVDGGARLFSSETGGSPLSSVSDVSEVWVSPGNLCRNYTISAALDRYGISDTSAFKTCGIVFEPVTTFLFNGRHVNPSHVVVESNAYFQVFISGDVSTSDIIWTSSSSSVFMQQNTGLLAIASPAAEGTFSLTVDIADFEGPKPKIEFEAVEQTTTSVRAYILGYDNDFRTTPHQVTNLIAGVNRIYEQAGMRFVLDAVIATNVLDTYADIFFKSNDYDEPKCNMICNIAQNTGGLELYFVRSFDSPIAGFNQRNAQGEITGIILPPDVTFITLAHEIGHSCGLADIYINDSMYEHHYTERLTPVSGPISYSRLPNDWGCTSQDVHFYYLNVDQQDLISHLLMHGHSSQFKADIPSGNIYGIWYIDSGDGDSAVSSRAPVSFGSLTSRNPVHK